MGDNERVLMRHPETGGEFWARPKSVKVHEVAGWVVAGDSSGAGDVEVPGGDVVPVKKTAAKTAADAQKES